MSLQYHQVQITPFEIRALHNLVARSEDGPDRDTTYKWLSYARSGLFEAWQALPDGHHLKDAYREDCWMWDDQDLASIPEDRLVSPEEVRAIARDLEVEGD